MASCPVQQKGRTAACPRRVENNEETTRLLRLIIGLKVYGLEIVSFRAPGGQPETLEARNRRSQCCVQAKTILLGVPSYMTPTQNPNLNPKPCP